MDCLLYTSILYGQWLVGSLSCYWHRSPAYLGLVPQKRSLGLGSKKTSSCLNLCSPVLLKRTPESILFYTDKYRKNPNPLHISANKDSFFDKPGSSLLLFPIVICYHNMEEKLQTYILLRRFYQWQHII